MKISSFRKYILSHTCQELVLGHNPSISCIFPHFWLSSVIHSTIHICHILPAFCSAHYLQCIPFLVMKQDMEQTRHLAEVIGKQWLPLLQHTIPKILVHILPYFAAGKTTLNFNVFLPFKSELLLMSPSHFLYT